MYHLLDNLQPPEKAEQSHSKLAVDQLCTPIHAELPTHMFSLQERHFRDRFLGNHVNFPSRIPQTCADNLLKAPGRNTNTCSRDSNSFQNQQGSIEIKYSEANGGSGLWEMTTSVIHQKNCPTKTKPKNHLTQPQIAKNPGDRSPHKAGDQRRAADQVRHRFGFREVASAWDGMSKWDGGAVGWLSWFSRLSWFSWLGWFSGSAGWWEVGLLACFMGPSLGAFLGCGRGHRPNILRRPPFGDALWGAELSSQIPATHFRKTRPAAQS